MDARSVAPYLPQTVRLFLLISALFATLAGLPARASVSTVPAQEQVLPVKRQAMSAGVTRPLAQRFALPVQDPPLPELLLPLARPPYTLRRRV